MKLVQTTHYSGSVSEFYLDEILKKVKEVKTLMNGEIKVYYHSLDGFEFENIQTKSSYGYKYSKERTLNQYRQTREYIEQNNPLITLA